METIGLYKRITKDTEMGEDPVVMKSIEVVIQSLNAMAQCDGVSDEQLMRNFNLN